MIPLRSVILPAVFAVALSGCAGYSHYFALPPGAEGIQTLAIEIFKNKTLYTDIEFEFTSALQREVCAKTPLRIAPRATADALLSGAIESYDREVLRESDADQVTRYSVIVTVSYRFEQLVPGEEKPKLVSEAKGLSRSADYEVRSNLSEADARAEAVRKVARKVVSHIFETW